MADIQTPWLTLAEGAAYARCSEEFLRRALADGKCRGSQTGARGSWRVHSAFIDAWLMGEDPPVIVPRVTRPAVPLGRTGRREALPV